MRGSKQHAHGMFSPYRSGGQGGGKVLRRTDVRLQETRIRADLKRFDDAPLPPSVLVSTAGR